MSAGYRHLGHAVERKDARGIVTGKTAFVGDLSVPRMLYGRVLRSPHAHARVISIDTERAESAGGVEAVLTHADVPDWRVGTPRTVPVLAQEVRFVGDAVALVAATTEAAAEAALDLIDVCLLYKSPSPRDRTRSRM